MLRVLGELTAQGVPVDLRPIFAESARPAAEPFAHAVAIPMASPILLKNSSKPQPVPAAPASVIPPIPAPATPMVPVAPATDSFEAESSRFLELADRIDRERGPHFWLHMTERMRGVAQGLEDAVVEAGDGNAPRAEPVSGRAEVIARDS